MKLKIAISDYTDLRLYVENALHEYGDALNRVIISNDTRLSILEADGVDVDKHTVNGISVIAEPFLPKDEIQLVLIADKAGDTV